MILLDTNVLSALRWPERHPRGAARLMGQDEAAMFASAITIGEIARGTALDARRDPEAGVVLDDWLDRTCLKIAATALVVGFTVTTRNTRHYCRFPHLMQVGCWHVIGT